MQLSPNRIGPGKGLPTDRIGPGKGLPQKRTATASALTGWDLTGTFDVRPNLDREEPEKVQFFQMRACSSGREFLRIPGRPGDGDQRRAAFPVPGLAVL